MEVKINLKYLRRCWNAQAFKHLEIHSKKV